VIDMLLVIKMGGSILKEGASSDLVADLKEVAKQHKVVLVHGGGAEVTEIASKLGKEQNSSCPPKASEAATPTKKPSKSTPWLWRAK
jgi:[amino group carrier protein]-L-2-aminoadipate 6-kinase